uniref:Uncharacterized protein n=1 Tax=Guillardia theta TaxID=55529 RepID=A0A7S4PEX0_GUITH
MNEEERLARALIQWRYPSNASQLSTREPVQRSKAEEKEMEKNQQEFRHALHSLYRLYKNGQCRYFYLMSEDFHVLFRDSSPNVVSSSQDLAKAEQIAFISSSTKSLRKGLRDKIVEFAMPLDPDDRNGSQDPDNLSLLQELRDFASSTSFPVRHNLGTLVKDGSPQSLLVVKGTFHVQSLYDFLYNMDFSASPTLLSPIPFLFATLKPISLKQSQVKAINRQHSLNVVTLEGPMLPSNLKDLIHCLDKKLELFDLTMKSDPQSTHFCLPSCVDTVPEGLVRRKFLTKVEKREGTLVISENKV